MEFFDLHCDTLYETVMQNCSLYENDLQLSLQKGKGCQPWIQCFAVWIPDECRERKAFSLFNRAVHKFQAEMGEYSDIIVQCTCGEELREAVNQKKVGAILTIEGGGALGGDLSNLAYFADCGVKMITLTWNGSCEIGDGALVKYPTGLTEFGRQVVRYMEDHNMVVDISHASDPLFYDVAEIATKPLVASHSNSRTICSHPRNLTDEQFCLIRDSGGLVGLNFYPPFLENSGEASYISLLKHAEHFLSLGGEKTLCIGSDFDGADMPNGIQGIQHIGRLYESFLKHGYKESIVKAIFFENAYKFFLRL